MLSIKSLKRPSVLHSTPHVGAAFLLATFLLLNTLKTVLFNMFVTPAFSPMLFSYKLLINLILVTVVYFLMLSMKRPVLFSIFYLLQLTYMVVTFTYFDYFYSYIHVLQSIKLFKEGMDAVAALSFPKDPRTLLFLLDLPLAIGIFLKYKKIHGLSRTMRYGKRLAMAIGMAVLLLIEGWHYAHNFSFIQLANSTDISEGVIVERYGTLANNLLDILVYSENQRLIEDLKYGKSVESFSQAKSMPNFVMIQIESMDASMIKAKYKNEYIAPFLQSLTSQSCYYPYTLSYHKGGATSDCEFSSINSVEPLDNYPAIKLMNYDYPNSLVHKLNDGGYETKIFHGNIGSYFNREAAFPKMGFKEFYDMKRMGLKDVGWGAPDHEVFKFAEGHMKDEVKPFFYYLITMTSHGPFTNAGYYYHNPLYDDTKDETLRNLYNSMSYVDKSIKDFVSFVRANTSNTYIFIYGDHTPNISNALYKQASFTEQSKYFEFVPMFILTPDQTAYHESKKVASFLDVSPTVLYASGLTFKIKTDGMNLLDSFAPVSPLPFKGGSFEREYLYERVSSNK